MYLCSIHAEQCICIAAAKLTLSGGVKMRAVNGQKSFRRRDRRVGNHGWELRDHIIDGPRRLSIRIIHFHQARYERQIGSIEVRTQMLPGSSVAVIYADDQQILHADALRAKKTQFRNSAIQFRRHLT